MSRVDKGGKTFKPLKFNNKSRPIHQFQTEQGNEIEIQNQNQKNLNDQTQSNSNLESIKNSDNHIILDNHQINHDKTNQSSSNVKISAAEKMKLKAQEAKANRSNAKTTDSIINSQLQKKNITSDIQVPTLDKNLNQKSSIVHKDTTNQLLNNQVWSPTIDPLLAIETYLNENTSSITDTPSVKNDILVPNHPQNDFTDAYPNSIQSSSKEYNPTLTQNHSLTKNSKVLNSSPDSDSEDISPRLKRKKHLKELRKGKKKLSNDISIQNQNKDDEDDLYQLDALNNKLTTRLKNRRKNQIKQKQKQKQKHTDKKQKNNRVNSNLEENDQKDQGEGSETDSNSPLDPSKKIMSELTDPHHHKGQSSQILESRLKFIIERRDREKSERSIAREENKRLARQALLNRSQSVKLKQNQDQLIGEKHKKDDRDSDDNGNNDVDDTNNSNDDDNQNKENPQIDPSKNLDQESSDAIANRKKLMEEYGLENSDSEIEDLEEVIFDEFANHNSKKNKQSDNISKKSKSNQNSSTHLTQNNDDDEEEEEIVEENFEPDDYAPQTTQYAPQLRLVDGQMVLDQDSLEVDRRDQTPQSEEMEIVEESDSTRLINSHTWSKSIRGERWTADETSLFYDALRLFGSDFEMITQLFPGRTRRQIRAKWNREEKSSPQEITDALMGKRKPKNEIGKELTPISEIDQEGEESETGEGRLVIPSHLDNFTQYAKIVGINCTGPIPIDPMDKWREKERLEWASNSAQDKSKASHSSNPLGNHDEDDEDDLVIEENFAGWGEAED